MRRRRRRHRCRRCRRHCRRLFIVGALLTLDLQRAALRLHLSHVLTAVCRAMGGVLAGGCRRTHLLQCAVSPELFVVAALLPHSQVVDGLDVLLVLGADRRDMRLAHPHILRLENRVQFLALAIVLGMPLRLHLPQQKGLALARLLTEA